MKILVASAICPDALEHLRSRYDVVQAIDRPEEELQRLIVGREALIFRSGVQITAAVMSKAPELKLVVRAGSGLDNLDLEHVEARGLELIRVPGPGARAVAEHAFGLMLALSRQLLIADPLLRQGHWAKHQLRGHLLEGKTLGVLGAGNIGTHVGRMGAAWGMRVLGSVESPSPERSEQFRALGIELVAPEQLYAEADYLGVHVPLNDANRNLIGPRELALMKPSAFLVNLARGGIVDEKALLEALQSGRLAGAGLDVHEHEGEGKISLLANLPNVVLTPHIGAGTVDSQSQIGRRIVEIFEGRNGDSQPAG